MRNLIFSALLILSACFNACAQIPSGFIAEYPLNNSANDISGNGYNGALNSTSAIANRFGTAGHATQFASGNYGNLPLALITAIQNDFSIGFWFSSTMTASFSSQWYGGNSLLDAEVCGVTSDWGFALIDGGKVCFGIGNSDITIKSTAATYNDGNWHFVTGTRNKTSGTIILYVDGAQVATTSGTYTGSLTAPQGVGLARDATFLPGSGCGATSPKYTGNLDDIIVYNRVLSNTEVSNLYNFLNLIPLPLHWLSFRGEISGTNVLLKWEVDGTINNDHFEIEHSTDGLHFSVKGAVPDMSASNGGGLTAYTFPDLAPVNGVNFYRIKQVDINGNYTYSSTIRLTVRNSSSRPILIANPVHDELVLINNDRMMIQQLIISDLSGRIVKKQVINSDAVSLRSDMKDLMPGYYLLQVNGTTDKLQQTFFLKQ